MTIEEKAKAYDIIIQRVSELYEAGTTLTREQMEYLFPELRTSEDERIRKCIVSLIEQCPDKILLPRSRDKMLSYIEKQKEQKPAEWSEEDEKMLTDISWAIRYCAYDDKKKKRVHDWFINRLESLRPSWKPSKDEERLINTSISFLKDFADKGYENAVECIDWLKSKLNGNL